jgi:hypothetical protein
MICRLGGEQDSKPIGWRSCEPVEIEKIFYQ